MSLPNSQDNAPTLSPSKQRFEASRGYHLPLTVKLPAPGSRSKNKHKPDVKMESQPFLLAPTTAPRPLNSTTLYTMNPQPGCEVSQDKPTVEALIPLGQSTSDFEDSISILEREAHASHLARQAEYVAGKGTEKKYSSRLQEYCDWWDSDQGLRAAEASKDGKAFVQVPAQPITATKVVIYLNYVLERPRVRPYALIL